MQLFLLIPIMIIASGCNKPVNDSTVFDVPSAKNAWLQDLDTLALHLSHTYGNIQEAINHRGLDPVNLYQNARNEISTATSDKERVLAFYRFLGSFRDGHLRIANFHPSLGTMYNYPIRLDWADGKAIVIHIDDDVATDLTIGDEVTALNGKTIEEWIAARGSLFGEGNDASRASRVLRDSTAGPFAPDDGLSIEAKRNNLVVTGTFAPNVISPSQPDANEPANTTIGRLTPAAEACEFLGASTIRNHSFQFLLDGLPEFTKVAGYYLDAGVLTQGRSKIGVVRFASFNPMRYREACEAAWAEYQSTIPAICDEPCQNRFKYRVQAQHLLNDFQKLLERLNAEKVSTIAVDLTGNGGGSDFADAAARMLAKPIRECQQKRMVKHPQFRTSMTDMIENLKLGISTSDSRQVKQLLRKGLRVAKRYTKALDESCDLSGVWNGDTPGCEQMTNDRITSCGLLPYAKPGLLPPDLPGATAVFNSSRFEYRESVFKGKVLIIADRYTSSAAELFLALLKDGAGATVIGERSNATGCGYVGGGFPIKLDYAGLNVMVPNCARIRLNGENEVFGIEPDIAVNWLQHDWDKSTERLMRVLNRLTKLPVVD